MTLTELSIKHGIEPEKAREFLREKEYEFIY